MKHKSTSCFAPGLALASIIALGGCAAAHVGPVAQIVDTAPVAVLMVSVGSSTLADGIASPSISASLPSLQVALVHRLTKAGIAAAAVSPDRPAPRGPVLLVDVEEVSPGSRAARLVIGFGAGHSELAARAQLIDSRQPQAPQLMAFNVAADSGHKPGLILPAGVAIGTADAAHMAIGGGADLLLNLRNASAQDVDHTAAAITRQVKTYYQAMHWLAPTAA